jgi:large subunit ribosomal protein L10
MNKQEKSQEVDSLREALKGAPTAFVLQYRGLTVNQVAALRKKVRATSSRYRVVKNRLALRALKETPLEPLAPQLKGPTAIAYALKEPAALAKVLDEFTKDNQGLQVKAGYVDGRLVTPAQIKALADLPSREVIVSRLLSVLQAPMTRLVTVLKGPARGLVQAMDQIAKQKKAAPGDPAPAAGESGQA